MLDPLAMGSKAALRISSPDALRILMEHLRSIFFEHIEHLHFGVNVHFAIDIVYMRLGRARRDE